MAQVSSSFFSLAKRKDWPNETMQDAVRTTSLGVASERAAELQCKLTGWIDAEASARKGMGGNYTGT